MAEKHEDRNELMRLMTMMTGDEKHTESSTSTLDVLWVLYDRVMNVDPLNPRDDDRDRFLLSKGHGPMAYYAVLARKGFIPVKILSSFGEFDSPLGTHPDRVLVPGVEIGSGSLGHGLPIAAGMVLGLRARKKEGPRIYCLVGDAELDEGSNFEAICLAGRLSMHELTVIVVDNHSASHGWPGGVENRFIGENWYGKRVDGRNHEEIEAALRAGGNGKPLVVVANIEKMG